MTRNTRPWMPLITLTFAAALAACGGSSTGTSPTAPAATPTTSVPTPTASTASAQCPTGATVGSALGITVPDAVGGPIGGGTQLPSGASGRVCEYHGADDNVIIEVITNIDPSSIGLFSARFPVPYKTASGVGDQARTFLQTLSSGKNNEGVVATKGSTLVAISATATPASLNQVEALVSQLL